jgi:DivIVA domain-containing protein
MPPLTPLDIQHKEFTKAMRGYAMHEVDTFLDQITEEFTRLQDEIARLRDQAANTQVGGPSPVIMQAPQPTPTPPPPPQHQPPSPQGGSPGGEEAIARALVMAQRMADQTVEEAKVKAKSMVAESEARAKSLTEQSQMRARELTEAAQMRARELTEAAQMRAREVTEAAQARARELTEGLETRYKERIQSAEARARVAEEQSRMQIAQATEQVARRRQELESSIEALRAFERDYRARLRGFVEGQLKALEDAAPSGPVAPPQPPGLGAVGNSRPLPGSEDLPALSTGARQVNNSYSALRDPTTDQLGNGRDRVDRLRHDD